MNTITRPNKYTLSRRAWPQHEDRVYCTLNGVDMISVNGYHASILTPQYAYIDKMGERNSMGKRATLNFDISPNQVKVTETDGELATLDNGIKLNHNYAEYYLHAFPTAEWFNAGEAQPIAIVEYGELVAVIMPVRSK